MDIAFIRKVNLAEQLCDSHPGVRELTEGEITAWDEVQIRAHYMRGPATIVSQTDRQDQQQVVQPGGGVASAITGWDQLQTPAAVRSNQLVATVKGYREQAIRDGIPFREHGLFPPGDSLLTQLASEAGTYAFEKHLAGESSPYELLKNGSWTSGDEAAQAGFDLRLFYKAHSRSTISPDLQMTVAVMVGYSMRPCTAWHGPELGVPQETRVSWLQDSAENKGGPAHSGKQQGHGSIVGAARLGERASIGNGYFMSAHGGAVESLLDEATAELGKMEFSTMLSTIEADFKIRKSVPLNTTLKIECKIKEIKGMRCWVDGSILDSSGIVLATCVAQLVDLHQLWAAQRP